MSVKRVVGMDIEGREVRIITLEKQGDKITNITKKYKPISLNEDEDYNNVVLFRNTLYATLDNFAPDEIRIKSRSPKGKGFYKASPISFKIEGIIQLYGKVPVRFTDPRTLSAYFKKHNCDISAQYAYQKEALLVAYHFLREVDK